MVNRLKSWDRLALGLARILAGVGVGLGLTGIALWGLAVSLDWPGLSPAQIETRTTRTREPVQYTGAGSPTLDQPVSSPSPSPTPTAVDQYLTLTVTVAAVEVEEANLAETGPVRVTATPALSDLLAQIDLPVGPSLLPVDPRPEPVIEVSYTSTAQVHAPPPEQILVEAAGTENETGCPATSTAAFDLIPIEGPAADRPDLFHGDLNITLRGYAVVPEAMALTLYDGDTALDPPQLPGLFQPGRKPGLKGTYRVYDWLWDSSHCPGQAHGCPGSLLDEWEVTLLGLATTPGEPISIPDRGAEIHPGGFKAMVLYAAERLITLGYTRRDTVAAGYVVHLVDVCIDPNLVALYQAQNDSNGRRASRSLPALRNDQILGTALGDQIKVAIRDNGSFMDPRSTKDWWRSHLP